MEVYSALELDSQELAVNRGQTNVQEYERSMSRQEIEHALGLSRRRAIIQQATREPSINYDRAITPDQTQKTASDGHKHVNNQEVVSGKTSGIVTQTRGDHRGHGNVRNAAEALKARHDDKVQHKQQRKHQQRQRKPGYYESRLLAEGYGRSDYRQGFVEALGERYRSRGDFANFREMVSQRGNSQALGA